MMEDQYKERKRWGFFGLPFTFTVYYIKPDMITIDKGFFKKVEDDCYMYKIQDVRLTTTFWERLFKTGTVCCFTADTTDQHLDLKHIRNAKEIKDFILAKSEEERLKRRTINTLSLDANVDLNGDGIPDSLE